MTSIYYKREQNQLMSVKPNPWVENLEAYVPGEQPKDPHVIKLNTNECPYPAPPSVWKAVFEALSTSPLNKYPDPSCLDLRTEIAALHGVTPNEVFVGNGSDEVLRLLCHGFLSGANGDSIGVLSPTYVLYETLAAMFGCKTLEYVYEPATGSLPAELIGSEAKVIFLPRPNPPIGTHFSLDEVRKLAAARPDRLVVIDEAYADFADDDAFPVYHEFENVVITRTFSKSYALAGMRVGYLIAREPLMSVVQKLKDSYNVNRASQAAAAVAGLKEVDFFREVAGRIIASRTRLTSELEQRGFSVEKSQGNFVFARRSDAARLYENLKINGILVRYFNTPLLADGIRITIGTDSELDALLGMIDRLKAIG